MSFMEKEVLAEKNPLYGRATGILKMVALNFYEAALFFPNYSTFDKILAYAILGGIPHYLKQFDDNLSLEENIKKSLLQRGSILYSEVEFLMRQELRVATIYNTAIQAIALGNTKLNDIHNKTQIEKNKLNVYLKNLIDLGIIEREFPAFTGIKEQANVQRGLYRITDNYFRFWYAFVFPNMSELETDDADGVYNYAVQPQLCEYASLVFEDVCREYIRRQNRAGALPFRYAKIGRWWNKTDELDIMALDAKGQKVLLGECKFKKTAFNLSELNNLTSKLVPENQGTKKYYYLFSRSGFTKDVREKAKADNIQLVDMNELI
jgi:AAA+ ATPase superfamily predicted ATPase